MNTKQINEWKTSDIRISKDSAGFYEASHKYQGYLYDYTPYASRTEARRAAVEALREKQDGTFVSQYSNPYIA